MDKPLFIPLKAEFFDAFASGVKRDELRRYGPRWNERVCRVGRAVTLSRGYGKQARLTGRIWTFKKQRGETFGSTYRASILGSHPFSLGPILYANARRLRAVGFPARSVARAGENRDALV